MSAARIVLSFVLAALSCGSVAASAESRPGPTDDPTRVEVSVYVIDVESIDDVGQTFVADCALRARWHDPAAAASGSPAIDEIWHPNIGFGNLRAELGRFDEVVEAVDGGLVQYTRRFRGEFASRLELHAFPFDSQTLNLTVVAVGHRPDEVELAIDSVAGQASFSIPGWRVELGASRTEIVGTHPATDGAQRSAIVAELDATRHVSFYLWRALVPLSLIVLLSWGVFWIHPDNLNPQIGVASTSILTLIAYMWSLTDLLPQVAHLTRLDKFVVACLILVLLAYVEALVTARMVMNRARVGRAIALDRWCRVIFPVVYLIIVLVFWL